MDSQSNSLAQPPPTVAETPRLSFRFWLSWIVLGVLAGGTLQIAIAGAPAVIEESLVSIIIALAPVVLILGLAWVAGRRLLLKSFEAEASWLTASYLMTIFAVFLGLIALGVALLLIPLGFRSRISFPIRWTLACGLGGVLAFLAILIAPAYLSLDFAAFIALGVLSFALMAVITGVALRSMLSAKDQRKLQS